MELVRHTGLQAPAAVEKPQETFGTLLRRALGEPAWVRIHRDTRRRFQSPGAGGALRFEGTMQWVHCSAVGALIARALSFASILPACRARAVAFSFGISPCQGSYRKERVYRWNDGGAFVFRSRFDDVPRLHEEFGAGVGMNLELAEEAGTLVFRDRGYFLRIGRWRIPLPAWATVGRFELRHRSLDADRFQVIIRVDHWLFGTLFYQRGEFRVPMEQGASAVWRG